MSSQFSLLDELNKRKDLLKLQQQLLEGGFDEARLFKLSSEDHADIRSRILELAETNRWAIRSLPAEPHGFNCKGPDIKLAFFYASSGKPWFILALSDGKFFSSLDPNPYPLYSNIALARRVALAGNRK